MYSIQVYSKNDDNKHSHIPTANFTPSITWHACLWTAGDEHKPK